VIGYAWFLSLCYSGKKKDLYRSNQEWVRQSELQRQMVETELVELRQVETIFLPYNVRLTIIR